MQKRVVIIGGGFAGTYVARKLQNRYKVILIDSKDYFEFTPSVLRTIVEPSHIKKIQAIHSGYLPKAVLIKGNAIGVTGNEVLTRANGIRYDYLVVCTGSSYKAPIKDGAAIIATRAHELVSCAQKLRQSNSVLIIGGGLVGVELAAEIIGKCPSKKVTVVHGNSELIERNPAIARNYAYRFLKKRNVRMVFGERVMEKQGKVYSTNKNKQFSADIAFMCTGISPNSGYLRGFFATSLDSRGFLKVNRFLQVEGFRNIFAAGDVTAIMEEKTAQNAEKHGEIIAGNIEALEIGRELKDYRPKPRIMAISLGKWNGIIVYRNFALTGIIAAFVKWFVEWKTMVGHKP